MTEALNLRNMISAQTPLLGDENTPVHLGPDGGTGFESATPRHQAAFTPNPLATPAHRGGGDPSATPRSDALGATPLRTPLRDNLSINPEDGYSSVSDTPREQRMRAHAAKRALKAGFSNLPKPENNFELLVPEDEVDDENHEVTTLSEEDAAERDARIRRKRDEEEKKALARRSHAVQQGLPRPANVDIERLLQGLSLVEEDEPGLRPARRLVDLELVNLLQHDSIVHPIPGTSRPGGSHSTYEMPDDVHVSAAMSEIHIELAASLGFPDANADHVKQGLIALSKTEDVDESSLWAAVRDGLAFDPSSRTWVDPSSLSAEARLAGYSALLQEARESMSKEANKANKTEKKLTVQLGGYQVRSKVLAKRITDAFDELQTTKIDLESFSLLHVNESAAAPRRLEALKGEVERLERQERFLQERYQELDSDRTESQVRIAALEEKLIAEAEALNEAALAEMDGEQAS